MQEPESHDASKSQEPAQTFAWDSKMWGCEVAGVVLLEEEYTWLLVEELTQGDWVWVKRELDICDEDEGAI